MSRPIDRAIIEESYAGAICPHCANYSDFDFILDNDALEIIVSDAR